MNSTTAKACTLSHSSSSSSVSSTSSRLSLFPPRHCSQAPPRHCSQAPALQPLLFVLLLLLLLVAVVLPANHTPCLVSAASYTSVQNGDWSDSATWLPAAIPGEGDQVTVHHRVLSTTQQYLGGLTTQWLVERGGSLWVSSLYLNASSALVADLSGAASNLTVLTFSLRYSSQLHLRPQQGAFLQLGDGFASGVSYVQSGSLLEVELPSSAAATPLPSVYIFPYVLQIVDSSFLMHGAAQQVEFGTENPPQYVASQISFDILGPLTLTRGFFYNSQQGTVIDAYSSHSITSSSNNDNFMPGLGLTQNGSRISLRTPGPLHLNFEQAGLGYGITVIDDSQLLLDAGSILIEGLLHCTVDQGGVLSVLSAQSIFLEHIYTRYDQNNNPISFEAGTTFQVVNPQNALVIGAAGSLTVIAEQILNMLPVQLNGAALLRVYTSSTAAANALLDRAILGTVSELDLRLSRATVQQLDVCAPDLFTGYFSNGADLEAMRVNCSTLADIQLSGSGTVLSSIPLDFSASGLQLTGVNEVSLLLRNSVVLDASLGLEDCGQVDVTLQDSSRWINSSPLSVWSVALRGTDPLLMNVQLRKTSTLSGLTLGSLGPSGSVLVTADKRAVVSVRNARNDATTITLSIVNNGQLSANANNLLPLSAFTQSCTGGTQIHGTMTDPWMVSGQVSFAGRFSFVDTWTVAPGTTLTLFSSSASVQLGAASMLSNQWSPITTSTAPPQLYTVRDTAAVAQAYPVCAGQCGDGLLDTLISPAEQCDDGNVAPNDGCTAQCTVQTPQWVCPTPGSPCQCAQFYFGLDCSLFDPCQQLCTANQRCCDGVCVNIDANNCLACGLPCQTGYSCCNQGTLCSYYPCSALPNPCQSLSLTCNDNNPCTLDSCDNSRPGNRCANTPILCDDSKSTTIDECVEIATSPFYQCVNTDLCDTVNCDDENPCTVDSCDNTKPASLCSHTPITCNDGISSTVDECVPIATAPFYQCVNTPPETQPEVTVVTPPGCPAPPQPCSLEPEDEIVVVLTPPSPPRPPPGSGSGSGSNSGSEEPPEQTLAVTFEAVNTTLSYTNSSDSYTVGFGTLREVTPTGEVVQEEQFANPLRRFLAAVSGEASTGVHLEFSATLDNQAVVLVEFFLNVNATTYQFGPSTFVVPAGGLKYSLEVTQWPFASRSNSLLLEMVIQSSSAASQAADSCGDSASQSSNEDGSEDRSTIIVTTSSGLSLQFSFLDFLIVDDEVVQSPPLVTTVDANVTSVLFNLTNFETRALLDPDFSVFFTRFGGQCDETWTGLNIASTVLIGSAFVLVFVICVAYHLYKNHESDFEQKRVNELLRTGGASTGTV